MGYHRKAISSPPEGVAPLPYTEFADTGKCGREWHPSPTRRFCTSNQRIGRSAVAARGRKHQRPGSAASYASMVPMGALVEAGGGYRVKPNGLSQKGNNVSAGGRASPPLRRFLEHSYPSKVSTPSDFAAASSCLSSDASLAPRVRAQWM